MLTGLYFLMKYRFIWFRIHLYERFHVKGYGILSYLITYNFALELTILVQKQEYNCFNLISLADGSSLQ